MNSFSSQSFDQRQNTSVTDEENFEKDDLVTFQHDSKTINLYYSQLTKYSKQVRESYLFSDVINRLPQEIHKFQEEFQLLPENIDYFFQLLQQNYDINEKTNLTYVQCIDLLKISKFLEVRKLTSKINQYIKCHNIDVDFVIQMIQHEAKTQPNCSNHQIGLGNELENLLTSKINECFSNEKFKDLPTHVVYRAVEGSSPDSIDSDKLFDFIASRLSKFCVLFPFLDLQKLSEDRRDKLCEMYSGSDENTRHFFDYLKCNLDLIKEISRGKKSLQEKDDEQQNRMNDLESLLQKQLNESEQAKVQLQKQLDEQQSKTKDLEDSLQKQLDEQQSRVKDLEELLQKKLNESEQANAQLQKKLDEQQSKTKDLEELLQKQFNDKLQSQINYSKDLENQVSQLQKRLAELFMIKGEVAASVENGFFINAEINLKMNHSSLDTSKSKMIISTSGAECLGSEAYENGEQITSLHMKTSFACKAGTHYVRCIVFNSVGESNEIVSNPVTTSGGILEFGFEGKAAKVSLPRGEYKLEVWGAKGGDSTGSGYGDRGKQSTVQGGFGGYSRGILRLRKEETVYVYVGEAGRPSGEPDGSSARGGFPDGGGAKTGHYSSYTTVPGTGGGSTSIRVGSDTDYARVIVAGGGGGASGECYCVDPGGFGGGLRGGNCSYDGSLQGQGAGTQAGSTSGRGHGENGDAGGFGSGAAGKYRQGRDSGGGGGGGWYGGGSGGFGNLRLVSSGGGGSGWTFTASHHEEWQRGDASNASKFALGAGHYLADDACFGGNEEFPRPDGNGTERGHAGDGYAKITLL